jgi:hypothetical protein
MPLWNTNPPDINPVNITNLVSWYGSNSAIYSESNILTSWTDKSRHGNNIIPLNKQYSANTLVGIGIGAGVTSPEGLALDSIGNIFVLDGGAFGFNVIKMYTNTPGNYYGVDVSASDISGNYYAGGVTVFTKWTTIIGVPSLGPGLPGATIPNYGGDNGPAFNASLCAPYGIALDSLNNIFIADQSNNRIRMVPKTSDSFYEQNMTSNYIYTVVGTGGTAFTPDATFTSDASINKPWGLAIDVSNNLFISEAGNMRIRAVPRSNTSLFGRDMSGNKIYTIVGNGTSGFSPDGTLASNALIASDCRSIAFDSLRNLFIADTENHIIRMVPKDDGYYYGKSMNSNCIYTIAGSNGIASSHTGCNYRYNRVPASNALLNRPGGLFFDNYDNLLFADIFDDIVSIIPRQDTNYFGSDLLSNYLYVIVGSNIGYVARTPLSNPTGVVVDVNSNLTVCSFLGNKITRAFTDYVNGSVSNYIFNNIYCYNTAQIEFQRHSTGATLFAVWNKPNTFANTTGIQNIVTIFTDVLSNATNLRSNFSLSIYNTTLSNFFINTNDLKYNSTHSSSLNITSYSNTPNILTAICFNSPQSDNSYSKGYINGFINSSNSNAITITNDRKYLNIFIGDDILYTDTNGILHSGYSYIYDVLIYNKVLTTSEISKVHRYLQATYNTPTLANGGNFQY